MDIKKKFHLKNANNSYAGSSIEQSLAPLSLFLSERNKLLRGVILISRFPSFKKYDHFLAVQITSYNFFPRRRRRKKELQIQIVDSEKTDQSRIYIYIYISYQIYIKWMLYKRWNGRNPSD